MKSWRISFGSVHEVRAFRERKKRSVWFRELVEICVVERVGSLVKEDIKEGDVVGGAPGLSCGVCYECQSGHDNHCRHYDILGLIFALLTRAFQTVKKVKG